MEFYVVYFYFDRKIDHVSKTRIKGKEEGKFKPGSKVTVQYDTEDLDESGRPCKRKESFEGVLLSHGQVRNKAKEMADKCVTKMSNGCSIEELVKEAAGATSSKRDSGSKMAAALQELKDEKKTKKKKQNVDVEVRTPKKKKTEDVPAKQKKSVQGKTSESGGSVEDPKKMTEMLEILGNRTPQKLTKVSVGKPLKSPRLEQPEEKQSDCNLRTPTKQATKLPTSTSQPLKSPTLKQPEEKQSDCNFKTPTKQATKLPTSTSQQTPRRSPKLKSDRAKYCQPIYDDVSPAKSWDHTFQSSTKVLLNIDSGNTFHMAGDNKMNQSCEMPQQNDQIQLTDKQTLCNILGISFHEASTVGRILKRCGEILQQPTGVTNTNQQPLWHSQDAWQMPYFASHSTQQTERYQLPHTWSTSMQSNGWDHGHVSEDATNMTEEMSPSALKPHTITSAEQSSPLPLNPVVSPSSSSMKVLDRSENEENLKLLITDPLDPQKFKDVQVDKVQERNVLMMAQSSSKPATTLLNGIVTCVFTEKELAESSGLGIRKKKDVKLNSQPLDPTKLAAIRGYVRYHCNKNNWQEHSLTQFNSAIMNKITNARKKLNMHPQVKCA